MTKELNYICAQQIDEIWRPCPDFEGYYEVSNLGRVKRSNRNNILKAHADKKGYLKVRLSCSVLNKRNVPKTVHRLVARAFIDNINNLPQINHIDCIKINNKVNNLEWTTNSGNQLHAYKYGLQPSRDGEKNGRAKLTNLIVTDFKEIYNSGISLKESAKKLKISLSKARSIIYGRSWKNHPISIIKRDERTKLFKNL